MQIRQIKEHKRILAKIRRTRATAVENFNKSLVCSEAVAPLFKNGHFGSFFACIIKPIFYNVEPQAFKFTHPPR